MSFDVLQDKIRAMKNPTVAGWTPGSTMCPNTSARAAFGGARHRAGGSL